MINVYNSEGEIIGIVEYNNNLDKWNGRNWQTSSVGKHLGITKLSDGSYVLIHGTDWQGETDYAEIISKKEAFQKIMKYNPALLDESKFEELLSFKSDLLTEVE